MLQCKEAVRASVGRKGKGAKKRKASRKKGESK